jgi:hypothetical protein
MFIVIIPAATRLPPATVDFADFTSGTLAVRGAMLGQ